MWLPEMNIFRSGKMREMGKGGEHEETQSSDGDFLDFLMSAWDMFCTDLPVFTLRSTALSHGLELSSSASTYLLGRSSGFLFLWQ